MSLDGFMVLFPFGVTNSKHKFIPDLLIFKCRVVWRNIFMQFSYFGGETVLDISIAMSTRTFTENT